MSSHDIIGRAQAEEQKLYVPGTGFVDFRLKRAVKAVEEYDPDLILAKHEVTGDWVAFVQLGPDRMFPVIGFGKELPEPGEIRATLEKHDTRRHGDKILRQINETNDRLLAEKRRNANEALEQTVDYAEFGMRKYLGTKSKIFIP